MAERSGHTPRDAAAAGAVTRPGRWGLARGVTVLVGLALCGCGRALARERYEPPRPLARRAVQQRVAPAHGAPAAPVASAAVAAVPARWSFLEHAARSCLIDGLARGEYVREWLDAAGMRDGAAWIELSHGLRLPPVAYVPQRTGSAAVMARARLVARLGAEPSGRGHVLDCTFALPRTPGAPAARRRGYTIYLPADYLAHPEAPRAVLVLVPGGRGGRARWFLPSLPAEGLVRGSGGLEVARRLDAWADAHPDARTPLVVAVDLPRPAREPLDGDLLGRWLPAHLLPTYLPAQDRARTAYGAIAVSAGAVSALRELLRDPARLDALGLLSLHCDPRGFWPPREVGPARSAREAALYDALGARRRAGRFELRFALGATDEAYACNLALYQSLVAHGVAPEPAGEPRLESCVAGTSPGRFTCTARYGGLVSYAGVGHHYRALLPALPEALPWALSTLQAQQRALR